jgi:hypothetical protein
VRKLNKKPICVRRGFRRFEPPLPFNLVAAVGNPPEHPGFMEVVNLFSERAHGAAIRPVRDYVFTLGNPGTLLLLADHCCFLLAALADSSCANGS